MTLTYQPADGGPAQTLEVHEFKANGGVAMAMHNTRDSIEGFARASFNYALMRGWPLYFSTKNTILKAYDGYFKDIFEAVYENEFKAAFAAKKLTYEHRLIDDMVACALKWNGALCLGLQELRRRRAVRHRRAGLRLARPDDVRAAVARRQDGGERGGARHGDAALSASTSRAGRLAPTRSRRSSPGRAG